MADMRRRVVLENEEYCPGEGSDVAEINVHIRKNCNPLDVRSGTLPAKYRLPRALIEDLVSLDRVSRTGETDQTEL